MTKRDFFIIIIRVFGLYVLINTIFFLPTSIDNILMSFKYNDFSVFLLVVLLLFFSIALFVFLLFYTGKIVTFLKLDKGFDDNRIEISHLTLDDLLKFAIVIIGGMLIMNNISGFITYLSYFFKLKALHASVENFSYLNFAISFLNIIVGYLLITNYDIVSNFLKIKN